MPPWVFAGELSPEAEQRYGAENCWKQWCLSHWGCSRNALFPERSAEEYDGGDTILFFTEDNDIREFMRKLSLVFKSVRFDYMWADEETGKNAGLISFHDGIGNPRILPEAYSREAYEITFDALGTTATEHGLTADWRSLVTCEFAGYAGHTGIDMGIPIGTEIKAVAAGKVLYTKLASTGYGYHVVINHGGGFVTLYAHNSRILVHEGQEVAQGDTIALSGSTGRSTGPHLHLEFVIDGVPMNPRGYLP